MNWVAFFLIWFLFSVLFGLAVGAFLRRCKERMPALNEDTGNVVTARPHLEPGIVAYKDIAVHLTHPKNATEEREAPELI